MSRLSSSSLRMKKKKEAERRGGANMSPVTFRDPLECSSSLFSDCVLLKVALLYSFPLLLNSPTSLPNPWPPSSPHVSRIGLISSDPSFPSSFSPFLLIALFLNSNVFFNQIGFFSLFSLLFPSSLFIVSPAYSNTSPFPSPLVHFLPFSFLFFLPSLLISFPVIYFFYTLLFPSRLISLSFPSPSLLFLSIFLSLYFLRLSFPPLFFSFPFFPFLSSFPFMSYSFPLLFLSFNPYLFSFTFPPPLFLVLFLFYPISFPLLEFPCLCFLLFLLYTSLFSFLSFPFSLPLPSPPLLSVTPELCEKKQTSHDFPACLINKDGYVIA